MTGTDTDSIHHLSAMLREAINGHLRSDEIEEAEADLDALVARLEAAEAARESLAADLLLWGTETLTAEQTVLAIRDTFAAWERSQETGQYRP